MTNQLRAPMMVFYDGGGEGSGGAGDGAGGDATGAGGAPAGGGAGSSDPWFGALPGDLRDNPSLTKYASVEELARGHVHQGSLLGKPADQTFMVPGVEDHDGRVKVLRQLGATEDAAKYVLTAPEGTDASLTPDGPLAEMFLKAAHSHSLLPSQAQAVYTDIIAAMGEGFKKDATETAEAAEAGAVELRKEWGDAFHERVAAARHAVDKLGLKGRLDELGLADDPAFARAFSKIGQLIGEDVVGSGGAGLPFGTKLAPEEAKAKGQELLRQAMKEGSFTERRRLNQEAGKFFQIAFPEKDQSAA